VHCLGRYGWRQCFLSGGERQGCGTFGSRDDVSGVSEGEEVLRLSRKVSPSPSSCGMTLVCLAMTVGCTL
jgi:hypothetical protein